MHVSSLSREQSCIWPNRVITESMSWPLWTMVQEKNFWFIFWSQLDSPFGIGRNEAVAPAKFKNWFFDQTINRSTKIYLGKTLPGKYCQVKRVEKLSGHPITVIVIEALSMTHRVVKSEPKGLILIQISYFPESDFDALNEYNQLINWSPKSKDEETERRWKLFKLFWNFPQVMRIKLYYQF